MKDSLLVIVKLAPDTAAWLRTYPRGSRSLLIDQLLRTAIDQGVTVDRYGMVRYQKVEGTP